MQVHWTSRQGRQRQLNCDAGALAVTSTQIIAMVVDAAEQRGPRPQHFANYWAQTITYQLAQSGSPVKADQACAILQQAQGQLRNDYLLEIGSYCLALLDTQGGKGVLLHAGDCIAAASQPDQPPRWLTEPHTLAQQAWIQAPADRHRLTRSLNARRFTLPQCTEFSLAADDYLLLCTDGYWAEHLNEHKAITQLEDDASALRIELTQRRPPALKQNGDCDNFYLDAAARLLLDKDTQ
jgi:serine/threonine protein phosphatase PrpC